MTAATKEIRIQTAVIKVACEICKDPQANIAHAMLERHFGKDGLALLKKKGLLPTDGLRTVPVPRGDMIEEIEVVVDEKRKPRYWNERWIYPTAEEIARYKLDFQWLLRWIAGGFGISKRIGASPIQDNYSWSIGDARIGKTTVAIIFARCLEAQDVRENLLQNLRTKYRNKTVLILTSSTTRLNFDLPDQCAILTISEILTASEYFKIDLAIVESVLTRGPAKEGFDPSFRFAYFEGIEYKFGPTQAAIIEELVKARRPLHKQDFMTKHSKQDNPKGLFYPKGKAHAAWDKIIKFDGKGNYWIDSRFLPA